LAQRLASSAKFGDLVHHPGSVEDIPHVGREMLDVVDEIVGHLFRVADQ
jgi:hypothetical protein